MNARTTAEAVRGFSMTAPGSRAKRSSSSVKGRPRSLSIASNILRSASLSSWRAASRSGVSGGDDSSGLNIDDHFHGSAIGPLRDGTLNDTRREP
jgi:hypothetical protein